jgi:hypothetical protein
MIFLAVILLIFQTIITFGADSKAKQPISAKEKSINE